MTDMIATEKVRHYGETVATVIAENRYIAEDACDLVEVEYEPLPVVLDPFAAQAEDAPLVHEKLGTNVAYERTFTFGDVDGAFQNASRKVQSKLRWPRSTSPKVNVRSYATLVPSFSWTSGAPSLRASCGSITAGSGSYTTSIRSQASSAM